MDSSGLERTQLIGHNVSIDARLLTGNELLVFAGKTIVDPIRGGSVRFAGPSSATFDNGSLVITENGQVTVKKIAILSVNSNHQRALVNNSNISSRKLYRIISSLD